MNREIKFRAWDGTALVYNVGLVGGKVYWHDTHGDEIDGPAMQYTGLKDRNGVEIYEGDVVKINNSVAEVKWEFRGASPLLRPFSENYWVSNFEVIGNIWENPELLK